MQTLTTIPAIRAQVGAWRRDGDTVALVPTMGNLHDGHVRLIEWAGERARRVVVSAFVNPIQFGPGEDYESYPRTPGHDARVCEDHGVAALFAPAVQALYPNGQARAVRVEVPGLSSILCGASRPGHFAGVATVVAKLFNAVRPDAAVFGEKDYQQLVVIRRVRDELCMPVEVIGVPIHREPDGLAMSSRNQYLTAEERGRAPALYRTLEAIAAELRSGARDYPALEARGAAELERRGFRPDYLAVRDARDLAEPAAEAPLVVLAAAHLGRARLIDNVVVNGGNGS